MRTEEQIIMRDPIKVVFGGKTYEIKPLVIRESREWRRQFADILAALSGMTNIKSDNPKFEETLSNLFMVMPDKMINLFFSYAKDLDREEIESIATDTEMSVAWGQVVGVAFPLLRGLVQMAKQITQ